MTAEVCRETYLKKMNKDCVEKWLQRYYKIYLVKAADFGQKKREENNVHFLFLSLCIPL